MVISGIIFHMIHLINKSTNVKDTLPQVLISKSTLFLVYIEFEEDFSTLLQHPKFIFNIKFIFMLLITVGYTQI